MNDINIKKLKEIGKEIISGKKNIKYKKSPHDIKVFRARTDVATITCANCGKKVFKQDEKQILFFCSKTCRKELRSGSKIKKDKITKKQGHRTI